jgi:hypothetical protein
MVSEGHFVPWLTDRIEVKIGTTIGITISRMREMGNAQEDLLNIGRKGRNVKLNVGLGLGRIAVASRGTPDDVLGPAVGG